MELCIDLLFSWLRPLIAALRVVFGQTGCESNLDSDRVELSFFLYDEYEIRLWIFTAHDQEGGTASPEGFELCEVCFPLCVS